MTWLWIILIIGWVLISSSNTKKKRAEQAAARERTRQALEQLSGEQAASGQPAPPFQGENARRFQPPVPMGQAPAKAPEPAIDRYGTGANAPVPPVPESRPRQSAPAKPAATVSGSRLREAVSSQLTEIRQSAGIHTVEASSISGHVHQETSLSGAFSPCPPERGDGHRQGGKAPAATAAADSSFHWDASGVRNGLIMAEILGKPKALRR